MFQHLDKISPQFIKKVLATTAIAAGATLSVHSTSIAQDSDAASKISNGGAGETANESLPRDDHSAKIEANGRTINIHREARVDASRIGALYFHRPLFALQERKNEKTDHPLIWQQAKTEENVFLALKMSLSTHEFRELARAAIIEQDTQLRQEQPTIADRDIEVKRWPIKYLSMTAEADFLGTKYGQSFDIELLTAATDDIEVKIKIPTNQYEEFLENLNKENIKFVPSYTFNNAIVAFAEKSTELSSTVSQKIKNILRSEQLVEGEEIFQSQANKLENKLRQEIVSTIQATDATVIKHLETSDISAQLLQPKDIEFKDLNGDLLKKVEAFLAPIIRKMSEETVDTKERNTKDKNTNKQVITLKASGSYGFGSTPGKGGGETSGTNVSGSGEIVLTKEHVKELEDKHKIQFTKGVTKDVIEPHSIGVQVVRKGWQESMTSMMTQAYIAKGRDDTLTSYTPVSSTFTLAEFNKALGANKIIVSPYAGVPKGIPMLNMRADIPKGWVALDGTGEWPKENWVAKHLQGTPLPDMRGAFARGAAGTEAIGAVNEAGVLKTQNIIVDGSNFSATNTGTGGLPDTQGTLEMVSTEVNRNWSVGAINVGQTQHTISSSEEIAKATSRATPRKIGLTNVLILNGSITGNQTIKGEEIDLASPFHQPKHAIGQWIMRIQ